MDRAPEYSQYMYMQDGQLGVIVCAPACMRAATALLYTIKAEQASLSSVTLV